MTRKGLTKENIYIVPLEEMTKRACVYGSIIPRKEIAWVKMQTPDRKVMWHRKGVLS